MLVDPFKPFSVNWGRRTVAITYQDGFKPCPRCYQSLFIRVKANGLTIYHCFYMTFRITFNVAKPAIIALLTNTLRYCINGNRTVKGAPFGIIASDLVNPEWGLATGRCLESLRNPLWEHVLSSKRLTPAKNTSLLYYHELCLPHGEKANPENAKGTRNPRTITKTLCRTGLQAMKMGGAAVKGLESPNDQRRPGTGPARPAIMRLAWGALASLPPNREALPGPAASPALRRLAPAASP